MGSFNVSVTACSVFGSAFDLSNFAGERTVYVTSKFQMPGISDEHYVMGPMSAVSSAVAAIQPTVSSFEPVASLVAPIRIVP